MAMLEMLTEVVGSEEFLRMVALPEFVYRGKVLRSSVYVCGGGEFLATVAANVYQTGFLGRRMKRCLDPGQRVA